MLSKKFSFLKIWLIFGQLFLIIISLTSTSNALESPEAILFQDIPEVITASRKAESLDATPNVMYVITKDEIRKYGYQTIRDVLDRIPGFFTSYRPLEPIAQIRGIAPNENNKITYMINGHRINNVNESTDLALPITLDTVERIEIIVGPGSVLYPAESLAAIVNLITKEIDGKENTVSVGTHRQDNTIINTIMCGERFDATKSFFASATYAESQGFSSEGFYRHSGERIASEGEDVLSRKLDITRPSSFLFFKGDLDDWSAQLSSLNQAFPEYSQNRESLNRKATRYNYVDAFVLKNKTEINPDLIYTLTFSYDNKRLLRAAEENLTGNLLDTHQKLYGLEYALQSQQDRHFFQTGLQLTHSNNRHNYTFNSYDPSNPTVAGTVNNLVDISDDQVIGIFASEEYTLNDTVTLIGALRADRSSMTREEKVFLSPRLAAVFIPSKKWTFKLMSNTATKFPSPWESENNTAWNFERGTAWATPLGPAKEPEILTTYEAQSIHYIGKSRLSINVYNQRIADYIAWQAGFTNIGDFSGKGIELQWDVPLTNTLSVWVNGSWQSAKFSSSQSGDHGDVQNPSGEMNGVPESTLNLGMLYQYTKDISLTTTVRSFHNQVIRRYPLPATSLSGAEWETYLNSGVYEWTSTGSIYYIDMAVFWEHFWRESSDLRFSCKNIFDNRTRASLQYANGDWEPRGRYYEVSWIYRF
ncbi:MAG: TonB-dependent receptor [Candidatus Omnitrophota bacterium]